MNHLEPIRQRLIRDLAFQEEYLEVRTLRLAARERMAALGIDDESKYWPHAAGNPGELEALRDLSLVAETGFFRDQIPFDFLPVWASERRVPGRTLRILSAPCSTGEEPYSIAMTLLEAGWPRDSFAIDAVDISRAVLSAARRGIYAKARMRNIRPEFLERFFERTDEGWQVAARVKLAVAFDEANLAGRGFSPERVAYDCVFCRNLLVYLTDPGRQQILANLAQVLAPDGLLIVGHAEASHLSRGGSWIPVPPAGAFAFQHRSSERKPPGRLAPVDSTEPAFTPVHRSAPPGPNPTPHRRAELPVVARVPHAPTLDRIEHLADAGRLEEAAVLCEDLMKHHGPNGRACYLLGLIRSAAGRYAEARELFEMALRLDPGNLDAQLHLDADGRRPGEPSPKSQKRPPHPGLHAVRSRP